MVDKAVRRLGREVSKCTTARRVLPGGADQGDDADTRLAEFGIDPQSRRHLFKVYGSRAFDVANLTRLEPVAERPAGAGLSGDWR